MRCAALATGWSRSASSTRPCSTRARDGIVTADADGIITYANPAANQISGIGQLVGRQIGRRVSTDAIAQTLRDGETRHVEQELIAREDGVEQIVAYAVTALQDRAIASPASYRSIRDVSDRVRADRRVAAEHAATRVLVEASTIEEALPQLTQQVCAALGWEIGAAWLVHNSDLQLRAVWSPQAALDEALNAAAQRRAVVQAR